MLPSCKQAHSWPIGTAYWSSEFWQQRYIALALCPQALILQPGTVHFIVFFGGLYAGQAVPVLLLLSRLRVGETWSSEG